MIKSQEENDLGSTGMWRTEKKKTEKAEEIAMKLEA